VALTATMYTFDVQLMDADRGVYETLDLRVAQHPSETDEYMVTRVLAYCLEYAEGIGFSKGIADPDEPAVVVRDLTGGMRVWIDIGAPDAARLHKAGKMAARVVVYTHRNSEQIIRQWAGARIHRCQELEIYVVDGALLDWLVARLNRRTSFTLSVTSRDLFITMDTEVVEGRVTRLALPLRSQRGREP
jgi:uncharacterized protein YaeQ